MKLALSICNQNAVFLIQFKREIPASRQKQKRVIYHRNCQSVKDVITPHLISDIQDLFKTDQSEALCWPSDQSEAEKLCQADEIWSKVKVTLTILKRKQVFSAAWDFSRMRKEDVHLTQFWSILTKQSPCGSWLCLCRPATRRWSDFQPSHWSSGPCEGLSLAADDRGANCDRRWSNYLISIPLQLSLWSPSLCTLSYLHIFVFVGISWL